MAMWFPGDKATLCKGGHDMICRVCKAKCVQFLDLGKQPIANNFLTKAQFKDELFYDLTIYYCPECLTCQVGKIPKMSEVFNDGYSFYTGTSEYMTRHFEDLALLIKDRYTPADPEHRPVIVEIGANDGTFLQHFSQDRPLGHWLTMGFEPSGSVAKVAKERGVRICETPFEKCEFPGIGNWPKTDVIVSANTFAHIPDRLGVLKNIKKILAADGVWINEEPYLGKLIERFAFDQFYNEHVFYTSITSMIRTLSMFDLYIDSLEFIETHGGSIRYFIKHGAEDTGGSLAYVIRSLSLTFEMYPEDRLMTFGDLVQTRITTLQNEIRNVRGPIIGYGAPAKMSTITNACGFGPDVIKKVYDTTPSKIGKFSPGSHIPVVSYDGFKKDRTKNVFLFIWNHKEEVMKKEAGSKRNWITPVINM